MSSAAVILRALMRFTAAWPLLIVKGWSRTYLRLQTLVREEPHTEQKQAHRKIETIISFMAPNKIVILSRFSCSLFTRLKTARKAMTTTIAKNKPQAMIRREKLTLYNRMCICNNVQRFHDMRRVL